MQRGYARWRREGGREGGAVYTYRSSYSMIILYSAGTINIVYIILSSFCVFGSKTLIRLKMEMGGNLGSGCGNRI